MLEALKRIEAMERDINRLMPPPEEDRRSLIRAAQTQVKQPWPEFARSTLIRSGKEMIPFTPYPYQRRLIELFEKHKKGLVVKTRQLGITEAIGSWMVQSMDSSPAYSGVVFSKTQEDSSNVQKRASLMCSTANIGLAANGARRIATDAGGQIFYRPSTDDSARGLESIDTLFFDEAAFPENLSKIYGAASPSQAMLGEGAYTILCSTPNQKRGLFWTLLQDNNPEGVDILAICRAVRDGHLYSDDIPGFYWFVDNSGWVKVFIHWRSHPVYSRNPNYLDYVREKFKLDEETLQREFNLTFDEAESAFFNDEHIDKMLCGQWAEPTPGHRYLLAIDTNTGGADYYCAGVIDITRSPYKLVAMYRRNKQTSDESFTATVDLIDRYRPHIGVVETNAGGQLYLDGLTKARPRMRWEGVYSSQPTKLTNAGRLRLMTERSLLQLPDENVFRDEFRNFIRKGNKAEAAEGFHDDTVMMLAIAASQIDINARPRTSVVTKPTKSISQVRGIFG